ncbi:MAG: hypothetical protein IPH62_00900 [Ignavibacteriae bacterium]|nr:hypothetical protein [Ignavibacteriota bacterium]
MKRILIAVISLIIFSNLIIGQENLYNQRNNIYLELLGRGGLFSINYEKFITDKSVLGIGLGYIPRSTFDDSFYKANQLFLLPISYNYLFDITNTSKIDFGAGLVLKFVGQRIEGVEKEKFAINPYGIIGYRYQPENEGILFRISFIPILDLNKLVPWIGVSIGYCF